MQVIRRLFLWLLIVPVCLLAADELKQSLDDLGSTDTARYEKARDYLTKHVGTAIGGLGSLVQDMDKPPLARLRAVMILGETKDPESVKILGNALKDGREQNARVRAEIVHSLAAMGQQGVVIDYFNSASEDSPMVRASIALALRGRGDEEAKIVLSKLASSRDDEYVFSAAAIALQETYGRLSPHTNRPPVNFKIGGPEASIPVVSDAAKTGTLALHSEGESGGKFRHASSADLAVLRALKAQEKNPNKSISETAHELLEELTELYGKR
jgi:HEAT repeat protein